MPSPISSSRLRFASMRGLLLALVAIVGVPSYALTITQTAVFNTSGGAQGNGIGGSGGFWTTFTPFDVVGGTLESVQFHADVTASVSATQVNPSASAVTLNPFVSLQSTFTYFTPGFNLELAFTSDSQSKPSVLINPGSSYTASGDFNQSVGGTFTNPDLLAGLSAGGSDYISFAHLIGGSASNGSKSINAQTTLTLTYNYHGVPDTGTTLLLLGLALVLLGVGQGRLKRLRGMTA